MHFWGMKLSGPFTTVDLPALGTDFEIPIHIVQGEQDLTTLPQIAKAYLDGIAAPRKQFVPVAASGHEPSQASVDAAHKLLLEQVKPLAADR